MAQFRKWFQTVLETIVLVLVVSLFLIVFAGVAFRQFGAPLVWYDEVAAIMLAWLTYYGAALAALHRGHIGFSNLVENAPPKLRVPIVIVREAVVIGFFAFAAWAGFMVLMAVEGFYLASLPSISRQLTQSVIPIGAVLFIIAELLNVPDLIRGELSGENAEIAAALGDIEVAAAVGDIKT
jgi:TRAP-type C4-dicarboxylate transport system permease small subunit